MILGLKTTYFLNIIFNTWMFIFLQNPSKIFPFTVLNNFNKCYSKFYFTKKCMESYQLLPIKYKYNSHSLCKTIKVFIDLKKIK